VKAVLLREPDGPLELAEAPEPDTSDGRALVRVRAAGINFLDVLIRRGRYPQMPELPAVLGTEVAGELEDGTRVMALTPGTGGYAEVAAVDRAQVVPLPDGASFAEGASFLLTFLTAYIPLHHQVRVRPRATVLVTAAGGGVGTATIQVARALGAEVIGAVGSEAKADAVRDLGAMEVYTYITLPDDLRVDVVMDPVGGELLERCLGLLKPLGTLVAIGFAGGMWPEVQPALLVGRNVGLQGFYLGRLMRHRPELVRQATEELMALWEQGAIRPVVGATFPLEQAADAHRLIEERKSVGKVVLLP
jgi:NADPH:quinone reductase